MYHPKIIENNKIVFIASHITRAFHKCEPLKKSDFKIWEASRLLVAATVSFHFTLYDSFIYSRVKHEEKSKSETKTLTVIAC